jgi:hypothetical protein
MSFQKLRCLFLAFIGLIISISLNAQIDLISQFDIGENNVSEGVYFRNSDFAGYRFGKMSVSGGIQFDIKSATENVLTGTALKVGRAFQIKDFPFQIEAHTIYNPFSDWVHEFNWGVLAKIQQTHFTYKLGTSFRTYSLTEMAEDNTDPDSNNKLHENWNLMYLVQYNLKPVDYRWNVGISITNIDCFLINQEVNPMFNLNGNYKFSESLSLFSEVWYKAAGFSNISVNYFGFFVRTGVIWKIDLNK